MRRFLMCFAGAGVLIGLATSGLTAADLPVAIVPGAGKMQVNVAGDLFCEVDFQTYAKPIVYPIYGPGQTPMTRNYPMQQVAGEANDHPHHKSMWFAHGDINGVSFWDEHGKIITEQAELLELQDGARAIRLKNRLVDPQGNQVCTETVVYRFGANDGARWIDWQITIHAGDQPLTLGDTKEGTAALRVHSNLQLENDPKRGVTTAGGKAINSEGIEGPAIWGQRAKWVDYSGVIDGQSVGIAFFDHPQNHGHPTYWHARAYGLFAANPFGASQFVGQGASGAHTVQAGESLEFRYRVVFHRGDAAAAQVAALYQAYAAAEQPPANDR
jgi:hypothetical protein